MGGVSFCIMSDSRMHNGSITSNNFHFTRFLVKKFCRVSLSFSSNSLATGIDRFQMMKAEDYICRLRILAAQDLFLKTLTHLIRRVRAQDSALSTGLLWQRAGLRQKRVLRAVWPQLSSAAAHLRKTYRKQYTFSQSLMQY